jgi:hypothetical protein
MSFASIVPNRFSFNGILSADLFHRTFTVARGGVQMNVPFKTEEFMKVLVEYNNSVWPTQFILAGLAAAIIVLAFRSGAKRSNLVGVGLGLLWLWMGIAYHFTFFTSINKAAWAFGSLFVAQGLMFLYEGTIARRFSVDLKGSKSRWLAAVLFLYALVIYPVLGHYLGHVYPESPTFGLPCPTTIFTFAILLVVTGKVLKRLLFIPLLWSIIGFGAAIKFGIYEDVGLLLAGLTATGTIIFRERIGRRNVKEGNLLIKTS